MTDMPGGLTTFSRYQAAPLLLLGLLGVAALAQDQPTPDNPPLRFEGYSGAPDFEVVSRKDDLFFYPCDQCHESMEPNPEIRELDAMHDGEIDHGKGRIWCLSCHAFGDLNNLRTLLGEPVDFDDSHLVCGGCHSSRHKDWVFGAHGKRVANWQGERTLYGCAHCHNPHSPAIEPRAPKPAPPVRAGLERPQPSGDGHAASHSDEEQLQQ